MNEEIINEQEKLTDCPDESCQNRETGGEAFNEENSAVDYEADILKLKEEFPGLDPDAENFSRNERYTELRAMGLSPREAYLATAPVEKRQDGRSHLTCGIPKAASSPSFAMPKEELSIARSIFEDMDDSEIRNLYKKVTK